jgi:hypothetical protein
VTNENKCLNLENFEDGIEKKRGRGEGTDEKHPLNISPCLFLLQFSAFSKV